MVDNIVNHVDWELLVVKVLILNTANQDKFEFLSGGPYLKFTSDLKFIFHVYIIIYTCIYFFLFQRRSE